jgi:hypothetical protein
MDGSPEGTAARPRRMARGWLVLSIVFALYLLFRLGEGVVWLAQHV